jgi:hypothetical protein
MNKLVSVLMLLLAVNGLAQVERKSEEVEKSFEPKYLQGDRGNRAIQFVSRIMAGRARIEWDSVLRQVVIFGSADHVAHAEELLRKFDVPEVRQPAKTFEFTIYLVGAYVDTAHNRGGPMPADLDSVIKVMRRALVQIGQGEQFEAKVFQTPTPYLQPFGEFDCLPEAKRFLFAPEPFASR